MIVHRFQFHSSYKNFNNLLQGSTRRNSCLNIIKLLGLFESFWELRKPLGVSGTIWTLWEPLNPPRASRDLWEPLAAFGSLGSFSELLGAPKNSWELLETFGSLWKLLGSSRLPLP